MWVAGLIVALLAFVGLLVVLAGGFGDRKKNDKSDGRAADNRREQDNTNRQLSAATEPGRVSGNGKSPRQTRPARKETSGELTSIDDLCALLESKGVSFGSAQRFANSSGVPGVWLYSKSNSAHEVLVQQYPDHERAKLAAIPEKNSNMRIYVWKQFTFTGTETTFFQRVRRAVGL